MKISYNWLKEFIPIKVNCEKLAADLTDHGLSVESVKQVDDDYIIDIEVTANRGDCLSVLGIAREAAAIYDIPLKKPAFNVIQAKINKPINLTISNDSVCPRYTARIIDNVTIKQSPDWIIEKLKKYGFRPQNNIVDITNLVMIENGQPLHAFDYDKISNGIVNIQLATNKDSVITLDGKERLLDDQTIIISDDKKIYDLSGIMGGYSSEIDKNTKTILLQSAIFNPTLIRKTSQRLRFSTDASYRYERGVDIKNSLESLDRATHLINKICPNSISGLVIDKYIDKNIDCIPLSTDKVNSMLGISLNDNDIHNYLKKLGFRKNDKNHYIIPSYRKYDISLEVDLIEEIARIYGYKKLLSTAPIAEKSKINTQYSKKEAIKDHLAQKGFTEIQSYSFADEKILQLLKIDLNNCIQIINPIAPENKYLRPNLLPSMLSAFAKNPWAPEINIFEIGKVFSQDSEKFQLYIATTQKNNPALEAISKDFKLSNNVLPIDQNLLDRLKIRKKIYYLLADLDKIDYNIFTYKTNFDNISYTKVSEYPPTIRDLAFIVDTNIDNKLVQDSIKSIDDHIFIVELFDEFVSEKFGKNKKNIAFHIWMQNEKSPLSQNNTDTIIKKIINNISNKYNARLR